MSNVGSTHRRNWRRRHSRQRRNRPIAPKIQTRLPLTRLFVQRHLHREHVDAGRHFRFDFEGMRRQHVEGFLHPRHLPLQVRPERSLLLQRGGGLRAEDAAGPLFRLDGDAAGCAPRDAIPSLGDAIGFEELGYLIFHRVLPAELVVALLSSLRG